MKNRKKSRIGEKYIGLSYSSDGSLILIYRHLSQAYLPKKDSTMPIVTLTTDFGLKDYYAGAVKGAIYSEINEVEIIDITHSISPFHILEASYILKNSYSNFPKGAIHIIGIDSENTPETKHLLVLLDGHYFVLSDNGILSLIATEIKPDEIYEINFQNSIKTNFPVLDVFVKVAAHLARGGKPEMIGTVVEIEKLKSLEEEKPYLNQEEDKIIGNVLYIDNYGNVVTNIKKDFFSKIRRGREFVIIARTTKFTEIFNSYSAGINFSVDAAKREDAGKKLALFNSAGYIELAVYKSNPCTVGSASSLFGLELKDLITIEFN